MTPRARPSVVARSPELKAGWPQQVWAAGTSTSQPASSSSLTAAKPTLGRYRSTRQVTKSATRGFLLMVLGGLVLARGGQRARKQDIVPPPALHMAGRVLGFGSAPPEEVPATGAAEGPARFVGDHEPVQRA